MIIKAADELGNIFVKKYENNVRIKKGRPNKKYPRFERLRGYYVLMVGVRRLELLTLSL